MIISTIFRLILWLSLGLSAIWGIYIAALFLLRKEIGITIYPYQVKNPKHRILVFGEKLAFATKCIFAFSFGSGVLVYFYFKVNS